MAEAKKFVIQVGELHDERCKQKAMKVVSWFEGIDSISVDMKEQKLTLVGVADSVEVVRRLRKKGYCSAKIIAVGPAKEPEKKKEDPPKKDACKELEEALALAHAHACAQYPWHYNVQYQW